MPPIGRGPADDRATVPPSAETRKSLTSWLDGRRDPQGDLRTRFRA